MKLLISGILLSLFAGCTHAPQNGASPSPANNGNQQVQVQQTAPAKKDIKDARAVADRLEQLAVSIPEVESARCVVFGNTAVVGINLPPQMDRSKVGTIKLSVAEALKNDPYGVNAIVTADLDLATRIYKVSDHIKEGRPISGFAEEMAEIIGRAIPQIPGDMSPTTPQSKEPQMPNSNL